MSVREKNRVHLCSTIQKVIYLLLNQRVVTGAKADEHPGFTWTNTLLTGFTPNNNKTQHPAGTAEIGLYIRCDITVHANT